MNTRRRSRDARSSITAQGRSYTHTCTLACTLCARTPVARRESLSAQGRQPARQRRKVTMACAMRPARRRRHSRRWRTLRRRAVARDASQNREACLCSRNLEDRSAKARAVDQSSRQRSAVTSREERHRAMQIVRCDGRAGGRQQLRRRARQLSPNSRVRSVKGATRSRACCQKFSCVDAGAAHTTVLPPRLGLGGASACVRMAPASGLA